MLFRLAASMGCKRSLKGTDKLTSSDPLRKFFTAPTTLQDLCLSTFRTQLVQRKLYSKVRNSFGFGYGFSRSADSDHVVETCKTFIKDPKDAVDIAPVQQYLRCLPQLLLERVFRVRERQEYRNLRNRDTHGNFYLTIPQENANSSRGDRA